MEKIKKGKAVRYNISTNAVKNIQRVKATLMLQGKELNNEETVNFMLANYTLKS